MTNAEPVQFLYVGQVRREKGVEDIVSAARVLLDQPLPFRISIAGSVAGWAHDRFAPELAARVEADADLSAVITFLGNIENVDKIYQAHQVHLAPSLFEEPYGLVIVEAKQNARPSIVYPRGGMIELIDHGEDGLICKTATVEQLVAAMLLFLKNPASISKMGDQAKASLERLGLVRDQFNARWADIAARAAKTGRRRA
ncbi:MAG: glycosyltransferase [Hyphomonadaceae bacterium]